MDVKKTDVGYELFENDLFLKKFTDFEDLLIFSYTHLSKKEVIKKIDLEIEIEV